ncbi:hypothetical protein R3P38DRAFT_331678 [Favolaschia claudopus]|uniref:SAM domain-containing protein n=1 Tax=Favolaschia claudopus TaxID=2862362 RepID=A0AAV9ZM91_9AGAR
MPDDELDYENGKSWTFDRCSVLSWILSTDGVGATGGMGEGPRFQTRIVSRDKVDLTRIHKMSIADFCAEYQLDDDVRERLDDEGIANILALFCENEYELRRMGFNIGSIAEIQAALKRRLTDEHPDIMTVTPRIPYALDIAGRLRFVSYDSLIIVLHSNRWGWRCWRARGQKGWGGRNREGRPV